MTPNSHILSKETIVYANDLMLWTESFGDKANPAIILVMGAGGQGILWPTDFCQTLAAQGYFVIRYDHRDTGLSSLIDYDATPYNLLDMAVDIVHVIAHYQIENAHIVGISMGGAIAMLLSAHYPERVRSLTLLATSIDFRPAFAALQGIASHHSLPIPTIKVIEAAKKFQTLSTFSLEEKIQIFIETAKINSGSIPVDEALCRELAIASFQRTKNHESPNNHYRAMMASHDIHAAAAKNITATTHVVHGDEDPVFPLEHGQATHAAIINSTFCIMPGVGHTITCQTALSEMITNIVMTAKKVDKHIC